MSVVKVNPVLREENDFYATPYWVTDALLRVESFGQFIAEPACGHGDISEVLKHYGHSVDSCDLVYRGYGIGQADFLKPRPTGLRYEKPLDAIITNPPYKRASEFFHQAHSLKPKKVALFLRLAWLAGARRHSAIFKRTPPQRVYVMSNRPTLWHGGDSSMRDTGGAIDYAWFVWRLEEPPSLPRIEWIHRRPNLNLAILANERARRRFDLEVFRRRLQLGTAAPDLDDEIPF